MMLCFHNWKLLSYTTVLKTNFCCCMCMGQQDSVSVPELRPAVGKERVPTLCALTSEDASGRPGAPPGSGGLWLAH